MLELKNIHKKVGNTMHIGDVSMSLEKGTVNVLLGPTLSGKTSLMRLMAGLDRPTAGTIVKNGRDVTGMPVQKRNVAMVYQQFINYPAMSVYENIASPMRVAGVDTRTIDKRVREAAALMKLTPYLERTPLNLSGGQQQRTALARALVKNAELVLLDEPLANLDYKLREELRVELPKIFAETGAIFVYATTEPQEALLLGGKTATLSEGRLTQFGSTISVYNKPANLLTAQTFSDPPMNILPVTKTGSTFTFHDSTVDVPDTIREMPDGEFKLGVRPHHMLLEKPKGRSMKLKCRVSTTEITGSESFIHLESADAHMVALIHGIHRVAVDDTLEAYLNQKNLFVFDRNENLVAAPSLDGGE